MIELRANTSVDVRIGSAVDATDGVTPETTLALGTADQAELLKADGAATVDISGRTFAAVTGCDGWYDLTLTTTDTNTLGELVVVVQDSSLMLPIEKRFMVVNEAYWDSKYSASANARNGILFEGVLDAGSTTTVLELPAGHGLTTAEVNGCVVNVVSGTGADQGMSNCISISGDQLTVNPAFATAPGTSAVIQILKGAGAVDLAGSLPEVNVAEVAGTTQSAVNIASQLSAILADTDELQGDWVNGGRLDLLIDAILVDTGTDIPALIAALNDLSAAQVNAEVVDVLTVDTIAELGVAAPAATPTFATALMLLYMALRNRTTDTATTKTIQNDAGTTIASASQSDDGTTYTKNEFA